MRLVCTIIGVAFDCLYTFLMTLVYFKYSFGLAFPLIKVKEEKKTNISSFSFSLRLFDLPCSRNCFQKRTPPLVWPECTNSRTTILMKKLPVVIKNNKHMTYCDRIDFLDDFSIEFSHPLDLRYRFGLCEELLFPFSRNWFQCRANCS